MAVVSDPVVGEVAALAHRVLLLVQGKRRLKMS